MREEKKSIVESLCKNLNESPYLIVADYGGMKVDQLNDLRNRLAEVESEFHIVKNTYVRKSLEVEGLPELNGHLAGATAICFGNSEVTGAAKILKKFASECEKPEIRVGIVDRTIIDKDGIKAIADLPPREVLLAKILGLINAPATKLAVMINTPGSQLAQVIKAKAEKG
ncbi:MAG: 50S ribosomal protein L10 [Verrucomicrobiota bacterium]